MVDEKRYEITVDPRSAYLPDQSDPTKHQYVFAYTITLTNTGNAAAQFNSRHWYITDGDHRVQEVKGLGPTGQQPVLKPGEKSDYTSGASIPTPMGKTRRAHPMVGEAAKAYPV